LMFLSTMLTVSCILLNLLDTLELHDNDLGGTVPAALCARRGEGWSDLKVITVDADEVSCSCCTQPGGTS
jgi:hypothetical protein